MKNAKKYSGVLVAPRYFLLALCAAGTAHGEEDLFFSDMPIVASLSRLPQQLSETPGSVTVIDQEMIRASGMRTVEDLLRLVPGFQVTSHNQDGAIVAYHGLNYGLSSEEYGPRVQVLVDGRSQYSPLFKSGVNWNLLPVALENIERIEVIRGSNTVSYGSNAFMGVVNIVTIDPALTKGWLVSSNDGNNGIDDKTLRWGGTAGSANVRFTYRSFEDNGFQKGFYSNKWTTAPDNRQSQLADLRIDVPLTDRDELQMTGTFARDMSEYGRPEEPRQALEQSSASLGMQWRRVISHNEEIKLRYAYTEDRVSGHTPQLVKFDTNRVAPTTVIYVRDFDRGGDSQVHELELEHRLSPFKDVRVMWGAGGKSIALNSTSQFSSGETQRRFSYRTFGNLEYRLADPLILNLGASLEHDSRVGWMFDPRGSLNYHVFPGHTVRLVVSRAHRNPSLYEVAGRVDRRDPNTGLTDIAYMAQGVDPERIDTVELGYLAELKAYRASADIRLFSERIPNYIQILPLALPSGTLDDQDKQSLRDNAVINYSTYHYGRADSAVNLEKVRIRGYEYQLNWRPFEGTRLMYNNALICLEADFTDASRIADDFNNVPKIIRQTRDSAPTHSQSAMLIQQFPYDVKASIMYFRASPMRWRRNDETSLDASERIDWRLAKAFQMGPVRGEVAYTMQMANESQYGRTLNRIADRLHWLTLRLSY